MVLCHLLLARLSLQIYILSSLVHSALVTLLLSVPTSFVLIYSLAPPWAQKNLTRLSSLFILFHHRLSPYPLIIFYLFNLFSFSTALLNNKNYLVHLFAYVRVWPQPSYSLTISPAFRKFKTHIYWIYDQISKMKGLMPTNVEWHVRSPSLRSGAIASWPLCHMCPNTPTFYPSLLMLFDQEFT